MRVRTRKIAIAEGITAGLLFGTSAIFIRFMQNLDTFSIAFWRLIIACLVLSVVLFALTRVFSFDFIGKNLVSLLILSFFLSLHFIFFISAVKDTTVLNATVLVNTTPIFSMLFSTFIFKVKPSRLAFLGVTLSFLGVCVIAYAETLMANTSPSLNNFSPSLKGDLEATLAALLVAFYLTYGRKIRGQMDILSIMLPIYLLTAIIIAILGLIVTGRSLALPTSIEIILPLAGSGILPTAAAHTLFFSSLSNLKSFETATMALLEPVGATLLGLILFQENPAPIFVFGAALILLGILFVVKRES